MFGQNPQNPDLEQEDLQRLALHIKNKYGYDFTDYAMSSFRRRVRRVLELYRIPSIDDLILSIEDGRRSAEEFVSEITVNVTEMFRDPSFWTVMKEHILPNLMLNHEKINIWHAGCSSGEEVYSMAIVLKELGMLDKATILATDIDESILLKAKSGVYPLKSMEVHTKNYNSYRGRWNMSYYYREHKNEAIMNEELIKNVNFKKHDLIHGEMPDKFDLVLCRNVMIYFNQYLQNRILHRLHGNLHQYGYLVIGSKESLIWCDIAHKFIVVNNEEKIYKKIKD